MIDPITRKIEEENEVDERKDISFDQKLMFVYHIAMVILVIFKPLDNFRDQIYLAGALLAFLVVISVVHKVKSNWSWPGVSLKSIPLATLHIVSSYLFLTVVSYMMTTGFGFPELTMENIEKLYNDSFGVIAEVISRPFFTPLYMLAIGIGFMNVMISLNFITHKKSEFESQCKSPN